MKYKPLHPIVDESNTNLATFWRRLWAFLLDLVAIATLMGLIAYGMQLMGLNIKHVSIKGLRDVDIEAKGLTENTKSLIEEGFACIPTIYFALMNYFTNGKTVGKWIMRIRIVSLYHHRISFSHCVERALGYVASTLELGLGFLQVFWNPNRMGLHDRIAETIVIQEKKREKKKK
ncbi:MAG TPA: RDD family protein [Bacteroidia bacterium]|nr:RDD family protein [Bacteroidia bacterium]